MAGGRTVDPKARHRYGEIYLDYATVPGATFRGLAEKWGVCHQRIYQIVCHVDAELDSIFHIGSYTHWRSDQTKAQIIALKKYVQQWADGDEY